jgi:methionyl-tRNA formyltransferase
MADNLSTRVILAEFARLECRPDVVFLQYPGPRGQWRRAVRKLRSSGPRATLQRILVAARSRFSASRADTIAWLCTVYRVADPNSEETRRLIRREDLDLLLIVTDTLLGRGTFSIPRLGTLNAHPGWLPGYRGLGSIARMLRDGIAPAVSVHLVDEGVDTGPIVLREHGDSAMALEGTEGEIACYREQARLFARAVELFETGRVAPIDAFLEPSSMARGLSAAETRAIYHSVRNRILDLASAVGASAGEPHSGAVSHASALSARRA